MTINSKYNESPKMVLKVQLGENNSVKIGLISVGKKHITDKNDIGKYYKNESLDFIIWSKQNFIFDERQLRLPESDFVSNDMVHSHEYESEEERYNCLKKLFNSLMTWSAYENYMNDLLPTPNKDTIIIAGDYWYVG